MTDPGVVDIRAGRDSDLDLIDVGLLFDPIADVESLALLGGDRKRAGAYCSELFYRRHRPHVGGLLVAVDDTDLHGFVEYSYSATHHAKAARLALALRLAGVRRIDWKLLAGRVATNMHAPDGVFFVDNVRVAPQVRRSGVATWLMDAAECQAAELGASHVGLNVLASNRRAVRLYLRRGYMVRDARSHRWYLDGTQRLMMTKRVR